MPKPKINIHSVKLDRSSLAYRRMRCAGFIIDDSVFVQREGTIRMTIGFQCVCGRKEYFTSERLADHLPIALHFRVENGLVDGAEMIEDAGAVSEEHLKRDGFSEEAIRQIRYVYELEEEIAKLKIYGWRNYETA